MGVAAAADAVIAYGCHFDYYANYIDQIVEMTQHLWHIYRYHSMKCVTQHLDYDHVHATVDALPTMMLAIELDRNHVW